MDRSDVVTLVALPTLRSGAVEETETQVYCAVKSVGMRETYAAAAVGVKPEIVIDMAEAWEYEGQPFVRHNGRLYKVYRTYQDGIGIELTLTAPVGLKDSLAVCYIGSARKPAWCAVGYIQLAEIDDAGLEGLRHELHLLVSTADYSGEGVLEFEGRKYAVRRTFQEDHDLLDLYIEERAGI